MIMAPKTSLRLLIAWMLCLPVLTTAQVVLTPKSAPKTTLDSMMLENSSFLLKLSSTSPDTAKATLRVRIREKTLKKEPIQGATVLLRRDQDKMLGRVTEKDGKCLFVASPATYMLRVQMTGLKTLEKQGISLEAGKVYDLEILLTGN